MNRTDLRCKEDNTKIIYTKSTDGRHIYKCPYCERKIVEFNEIIVKI